MRMLPIGTIVKLDIVSSEKIMIISRLAKRNEADVQLWDYCGCAAPDGFMQADSLRFFNHDDIQQLLFIGFQDEQELKYSVALSDYKDKTEKKETI